MGRDGNKVIITMEDYKKIRHMSLVEGTASGRLSGYPDTLDATYRTWWLLAYYVTLIPRSFFSLKKIPQYGDTVTV